MKKTNDSVYLDACYSPCSQTFQAPQFQPVVLLHMQGAFHGKKNQAMHVCDEENTWIGKDRELPVSKDDLLPDGREGHQGSGVADSCSSEIARLFLALEM